MSVALLLVALDRERTGWWVAYGISLAAILLTHYTGLFVVAAQVLWALWMRPRRRREILLACVTGALVFAPWIPSVKGEQIELYGEVANLQGIGYGDAALTWLMGLPLIEPADIPGVPALILLAVALLWGLAAGLRRVNLAHGVNGGLLLVAGLSVATPAAILVYSLVRFDLFTFSRNLAASLPFAALTIGWVLTRPGWPRAAGPVALAGLAGGIGVVKTLEDRYSRPDYPGVAAYVDAVAGPRDRVVYGPSDVSAIALGRALRVYYDRAHAAALVGLRRGGSPLTDRRTSS